ncbi:Activator heat shock protein ATPase 1 [Merluccius polli]|uniref:Activator heat shock protein ATPase 1 n=1 Tax=Merluccius polli TaxID=89951 RepID=A0AA47NMA3_MERPO|nr:Activator heat shock protein ATPase 1 [Merluccius polli]
MAKWGEGDPRWIVEERSDATNVNNWHWTERDVTGWSSDKLRELLIGCRVEQGGASCQLTDVTKLEGEASINNRKGKLIFFYEWVIKASWLGTTSVGIKYKGTLEVANLSDENDMDDLDISVSLCKDEPVTPLLQLMKKEGVAKVRKALGEYVTLLKSGHDPPDGQRSQPASAATSTQAGHHQQNPGRRPTGNHFLLDRFGPHCPTTFTDVNSLNIDPS